MKILIGICGIGNGHSARQSLIIEKLLQRGAEIAVFCFGKSLESMIHSNPGNIPFKEVYVPWIFSDRNGIDWEKTETRNVKDLARKNHLNSEAFTAVPEMLGGLPDVCISDYEPVTAEYAYKNDIPLVTIDQQSKFLGYKTKNIGKYSRIEERSRLSYFFPYAEARFAVSFYPLNAERDKDYDVEIIPAPIRKEIVHAQREHGYSTTDQDHTNKVLIYFSPYGPLKQNMQDIIHILGKFKEKRFFVYNNFSDCSIGPPLNVNHIRFESFDRDSFARNLATAGSLICTAGHTLVSEAVYSSVPIYAIPFPTYDQHYCTKMVDQYQIGLSGSAISENQLENFFSALPAYKNRLSKDNNLTLGPEISEFLIERIWDIASSHSRAGRYHIPQSSSQTGVNPRTPVSFSPKDAIINPDFDEPSPDHRQPHRIDYKTAVVKPTMKCVCNCLFCRPRSKTWWDNEKAELTLRQWREVFSQLKDLGFERVQVSGGEPLLYPHLEKMIESIRANGLAALLNTNGFLLTADRIKILYESGLNGINFSLDSPKPSIHDFLRNRRGIWKKCVDAIKSARDYDDRLSSAIRTVLTSYNLMDLPEMLKFAAELGVSSLKLSYLEWSHQGSQLFPSIRTLRRFKDVVLPFCQELLQQLEIPVEQKTKSKEILGHYLYPEEMNSLENYARGRYWNSSESSRRCKIPYSLIIIYGDGRVLPCNAAEYARNSLPGNLSNTNLEEILSSSAMDDFRDNPPDFCINCPMYLHVTLPLSGTFA